MRKIFRITYERIGGKEYRRIYIFGKRVYSKHIATYYNKRHSHN